MVLYSYTADRNILLKELIIIDTMVHRIINSTTGKVN